MEQLQALKEYLKDREKIAIAFSGGVDSAFLLKVAHDVLGDHVIAITAKVRSFPMRELELAKAFCEEEGIRHIILDIDELAINGFVENPPNRCYLCKKELFRNICEEAKKQGMSYVAEASNLDDNGDYRPGLRAVEELQVLSPLREIGIDKKTIRALSRELQILMWDKPSFACLATRFVYGERITADKLSMVDKAEQFLFDSGFRQVRVRVHESGSDARGEQLIARIEIAQEEFSKMMSEEMCERVHQRLKEIGFAYVSLDLGGYRMGSMNGSLVKNDVIFRES